MFGLAIETWVIIGLGVLGLFLLMSVLAGLYRKVGPHEALVVYGFRKKRVLTGGGTVVFPMVQSLTFAYWSRSVVCQINRCRSSTNRGFS